MLLHKKIKTVLRGYTGVQKFRSEVGLKFRLGIEEDIEIYIERDFQGGTSGFSTICSVLYHAVSA